MKQHIYKIVVVEKKILRWICRNTRKDMIQNEELHLNIRVASIDEKRRESHLR